MLFDFSKVLMLSPTAFSCKCIGTRLNCWTQTPKGVSQWLHVQLAADKKHITMKLILRLTQFSVFINSKCGETECALSDPGGAVNMLTSRDSLQRGLETLEG